MLFPMLWAAFDSAGFRVAGAAAAGARAGALPPVQLQLMPTPLIIVLELALLTCVLQSGVDAKLKGPLVVTWPPIAEAQPPPAEGHVKVTIQDFCAAARGALFRAQSSSKKLTERMEFSTMPIVTTGMALIRKRIAANMTYTPVRSRKSVLSNMWSPLAKDQSSRQSCQGY
jgi:hypothetical protein